MKLKLIEANLDLQNYTAVFELHDQQQLVLPL
jgi:hypothetical protein